MLFITCKQQPLCFQCFLASEVNALVINELTANPAICCHKLRKRKTDFAPVPTLLFQGIQAQFSQLGTRLKGGWDIAEASKETFPFKTTNTGGYKYKFKGLVGTRVCSNKGPAPGACPLQNKKRKGALHGRNIGKTHALGSPLWADHNRVW